MKNKSMVLLLSLVFISLSFNISSAQDPGEPDTVRFEQWGTCVPRPPCSGTAVVPIVVFNDEELATMRIPVIFGGPVVFDSGKFVGPMAEFLEDSLSSGVFDIVGDKVAIVIGSLSSTIPPGYGTIAHLFLTVSDTGLATIYETMIPPLTTLRFLAPEDIWIVPVFLNSEFYIRPQEVLPGDIDDNGVINLSDAIGLANYFLKGGPPPVFSGSADVNTDCQINFSDIILIAKWYFTGQTPLQPGCAY